MTYFRFPAGPLLAAVLLTSACQTTAPTETGAATATPAPPAGATTPAAPLRNTRWVLRQLQSAPVTVVTQEPYLLLRGTELLAEGHGGCNRFTGSFQLPADNQLRLGPLRSTRMACAEASGNQTEGGFMRALEATRTYQISGDTLRLFAEAATQPTAVLHAVYL